MAPPSRDVRRQRFARWVTRALVDARARGLTVPEIERRTRVSKATFYRWRAGEWTADPRGSQVRAFADGLGIAPQQAYDALGWSTDRVPEPEPPMDPDVRLILHALASPDVSEHAKVEIRAMLRMIAELHRRGRRREAS